MRRSSSERSTSSATDSTERTIPVPWHMAHELTRHFHQAEMADASDLNARAIVAQRFLQAPLDQPGVTALIHVDEVDDDQAGKVAQAKLTRDFLGGLEVGLERGVLDIVLARGLAGVDVDGNERLSLIDDDIASGLEHHLRGEHRRELALHLMA